MIAEKQVEIQVYNDGDDSQSSIGMTLDLDSQQMLMQMLSKNLYADGIGSTIRETASNALDSHRRAGVTDVPIIVSLVRNSDDNYEFCVEDFGAGLDDNDVANVISKYGKSTKRGSANELGMFGLGFKSPLAYSSSFYFTCRKDGMERKYMMYEGDDQNTIDLLYEAPTSERNGVKIIVPIKYSDRSTFFTKIREQLAYFESVYFNVDITPGISNDFLINRGELYQYSQLSTDNSMHICLDNVYYPIDFSKLGISSIFIPVGLRFNLTDGLYPTPNRESLRYTNEAKETILKRIAALADHFIVKYNDSITVGNDVDSVFDYYNSNQRFVEIGDNLNVDIKPLLKFGSIPLAVPVFSTCPNLDMKALAYKMTSIMENYTVKYKLASGRFSEMKSLWQQKVKLDDFNGKNYLLEDRFCGVKKTYFREGSTTYQEVKFIKKESNITLRTRNTVNYMTLLSLNNHPKAMWRTLIKEFLHLQSLYINRLTSVDNFTIPQQWIDNRKAQGISVRSKADPRPAKLVGDIIGKIGVPLLRSVNQKYSKLEPITLKLSEIENHDTLYVYGSNDDVDSLDRLYHVALEGHKISTLVFSDRELKSLEKISITNLIPLSKFMEGTHITFRRIVTSTHIAELIQNYQYVFSNRQNLNRVSLELLAQLEELVDYKSKYHIYSDATILESMKKVSEDFGLYDDEMYTKYCNMKNLLLELKFLDPVLRTMSPYLRANLTGGDDMVDILRDLCDHYNYPIDPIVVEEIKETV
jgi:hypothetical protein